MIDDIGHWVAAALVMLMAVAVTLAIWKEMRE